MDFKKIINYLNSKIFGKRKVLPKAIDRYPEYRDSIDIIGLINMFVNNMPEEVKKSIEESPDDVWNTKLSTSISYKQLISITESFFKDVNNDFADKITSIIDGSNSDFKLTIDKECKVEGGSKVSNPNKRPITIEINEHGDLRDVYSLVHELTHCLDIDKGDNATRKILGEVAPHCMERMLDKYLIKNCYELQLDKDTMLKDIEMHGYASFLAYSKNAMELFRYFNGQTNSENLEWTKDQTIDSRYALAILYSPELMKNDFEKSKEKLSNFIHCVSDNDFYGANNAFGIKIGRENTLQRENLIKKTLEIVRKEPIIENCKEKHQKRELGQHLEHDI